MNAPQFRADDLAAASGLAPASIEMLVKGKLAPPSENEGRGRGRIYSTTGLEQMINTGALFSAGLELTPAARLSAAISGEFCSIYGFIPDRLDDLFLKWMPNEADLFWDLPRRENSDGVDRFALYSLIRKRSDFAPFSSCRGDMFIEIIDRRFAFFGYFDMPGCANPFGAEPSDVTAAYRLVGWERGSRAVNVIPISDEMPPIGHRPANEQQIDAWNQAKLKIEAEYFAARRKAVSATRVNISLAIRNGFEAVIQHRGVGSNEMEG